MNRFSVKCPQCTYPLDAELYNTEKGHQDCPSCKSKLSVYALPALYRKTDGPEDQEEAGLEEAACFYHDGKKAAHLCDDCGRFLCALCTLPVGNEMLCASCLELRRKQETGEHTLRPRQVRYDKLAIGLAVLPLIIYFPITFVTAPATLFVAIRYWNRKLDFAPGMRSRMALALIVGLLEIAGWVIGISLLVREISSGG